MPEIRTPEAYAGKRELDALILIMYLFGGLGALLASLLVANTLSATVSEQVREIAIIKAIGGSQWQIVVLYACKAWLYGLVGSTLGIGVGLGGGWWLLRWLAVLGNAAVTFAVAPEAVAVGLAVGLLVSTLGGVLPARRAARLAIADTLAAHGIESAYGQGASERLLARLRLPALWAMALRDLWRRKMRTTLTLGVIALAVAAFVGANASRQAVDGAIDAIYRTYYADAWAWLDESVGPSFEGTLEAVEGVYRAEMWGIADGVVALAEARLWGLPDHATLYREELVAGRWFAPGAGG